MRSKIVFTENDLLGLTDDYTEIEWRGTLNLDCLCSFLRTNKTIRDLKLVQKKIGDSEAQSIAEALKCNSTVATVVLSYNRIGDQGAEAIADVLLTNSTIKEIVLYSNCIGDRGARAFAQALQKNSTLERLGLGGNYQIGVYAIIDFRDTLLNNFTITEIRLDSRRLFSKHEQEKNFLARNSALAMTLKTGYPDYKCKRLALVFAKLLPIYLLLNVFEYGLIFEIEEIDQRFSNTIQIYRKRHLQRFCKSGFQKRAVEIFAKFIKF